jgi:V8-like Glu-specific endopeptidase
MDRRLAVVLLFVGAFLALASSFPAKRSQYSRETIEESRMMTLDRRTGEVSYQTDAEVIRSLDLAHSSDFSTLFTSPGMPIDRITKELDGKEKRAIIGGDSRFPIYSARSHPLCAIGELISSTGRGYCTVYLINPYHAMTSAHCVYNITSKKYFTDLDVAIRKTCYQRGISADVLKVTLNSAYKLRGDRRYDFALLLLNSSQIESTCYLGLGYQKPPPTFTAAVCGYPYDKQRFWHLYHCMYCGKGTAQRFCGTTASGTKACDDNYIAHDVDTTGGMNGGPLLMNKHPGTTAFVSYGVSGGWFKHPNGVLTNRAVAFNQVKLTYICVWLKANGGVCNLS